MGAGAGRRRGRGEKLIIFLEPNESIVGGASGTCACACGGAERGGRRSDGAAAGDSGRPGRSPRAGANPPTLSDFALDANSASGPPTNVRACVCAASRTPFVLLSSPRR